MEKQGSLLVTFNGNPLVECKFYSSFSAVYEKKVFEAGADIRFLTEFCLCVKDGK